MLGFDCDGTCDGSIAVAVVSEAVKVEVFLVAVGNIEGGGRAERSDWAVSRGIDSTGSASTEAGEPAVGYDTPGKDLGVAETTVSDVPAGISTAEGSTG